MRERNRVSTHRRLGHFENKIFMFVKAAKNPFLQVIKSLKATVVGQVFPIRLMVKFATNPITVMA